MAVKWYPDKPDRLAYDHYVSLTPGPFVEVPRSDGWQVGTWRRASCDRMASV